MKLLLIMLLVCGQAMAQVPFILTATNTDTMTLDVLKVLHFEKDDTSYITGFQVEDIPMNNVSALRYEINLPENSWYMILYGYPDGSVREMYIQTGPTRTEPIILYNDQLSEKVTNLIYHKKTNTYEKVWRSSESLFLQKI